MEKSYAQQFQDAATASTYDQSLYAKGSYGDLLWSIERDQLKAVIQRLRQTHPRIECLDFAAGSGRISAFLESEVDALTAIEIAEAMCARAREKLKKTHVICADITPADAPVEGKYDLITAFRFILNAEPSLRAAGVRALTHRLRDPQSRLVINNHGNLWSYRWALWFFVSVKRLFTGRKSDSNFLTDRQVRQLFRQSGLRVHQVMGAGMLSAHFAKLVSPARAERIERRLSKIRLLRPFCVNQMYVLALDSTPATSAR